MKNQTKAMVMGSFVVVFWATIASAFKIALSGMSYVTLLLIASLTTLVITYLEILRTGKMQEVREFFKSRKRVLKGALQGLLNPFLYYMILLKAYSLLPAQIAQPLNFSWQVVLVIMLAVYFKQKLKLRQITGVLISFAGILLLSANNSASLEGKLSLLGICLAVVSAFVWATYWISKIDLKEDSTVTLFVNFIFGSIYMIAISLFTPFELPALKPLLAAIYVGCFEMGVTFILWGKALNLATNRVALAQMTYITPILSLVIISIVLGEVIGLLTVGGLVLIIAGILVSSLKRV